ncbi:glycerol-3-phosphate 1-O-acyltransferase PlsY [Bordetella avium]|uniref:Glycerol-3-phosphate acyltransferase n=1 Tax=Bordetella avium (strain 197N) TaxID=360910 RepID=PLSY_BORA1|nr:glycerol-3-phosphate 1-O-acyltransferase PlsY [Bordetella avium]Q2L004.1 RecName: Full=Glycerol-3-phosphate acyltransferase; AltName: Full=Acyl-PO4 G3P acyltransferase; AltName: Full=Acyl-phosphate--glycerol-3-phosphate acyltransferase; AltName: Full=G3P acyltransferase; Short=GPAT; AltName: Full=Lysophosphatidic acid synthase; Short=LPA synthase [Bordetella avium 197N]AZY49313.1 glycerol-3-phosphate acyltransferase [Bordetella avium]AZY52668.1 glycerol-3-phosphate acyltransferase [Bordetella
MILTEPSPLFAALLIVLAYLIGCVPFAVVVSKLMGLKDPRSYGSKNPGATNVLRTGNKTAAALTLLGDAAKGWFALWLALKLAPGLSSLGYGLVLIAVFLGHLYPVSLGFKGGKGVATALGVLFAVSPWLALATVATWLLVAVVTRYSSLAALVAAFLAPVYYFFGGGTIWPLNAPTAAALVGVSALLFYRHSANIDRLIKGKESRIGSKKA